MKVEYKKCGSCDTWQYHFEGHDECLRCEGQNENIISEIIKEADLISK